LKFEGASSFTWSEVLKASPLALEAMHLSWILAYKSTGHTMLRYKMHFQSFTKCYISLPCGSQTSREIFQMF
jgi:hypothetical protein